ncbi:ArnT family glycosyltransferase [Dyadobacter sp. MSC1_007]|jgi:hypothetical protein|uniref:ArnT family glycosyltransferase n=1 Tax=Dyadobacter sp. MSC1_007 TaxID=2909264 RepID=UPI00202F9A9A|nr:glycosyltransferase family 39 protein [Dyadobacter sp. MSC1_007]
MAHSFGRQATLWQTQVDMEISKRPLLLLIVAFTAIRCIIACAINLGNDEVYYFTYAILPDWNHFDHPPLVGIFIRLFTFNLHWNHELMVRMPGIIGAAVNTWFIFRCGELISNKRTGTIAAILYNTSIYSSIIAGIFILPDSIQVVFWLAALYSILMIAGSGLGKHINLHLLLFGFWTGLAVMSKVHGVFLWFGFGGYILFHRRDLFQNPYLYLSLGITALLSSPILFWNIQNDFITWRFHSERVTIGEQGIDLKSFLRTTIGQILYCNPITFALYILTGNAFVRGRRFMDNEAMAVLLWCSLPIIASTTLVSLFRDTLPHWSGPGFIGFTLITAAFLNGKLGDRPTGSYQKSLNACIVLIAFVFVAGPLLIRYYPGTMSPKTYPRTGSGDATLDVTGWETLRAPFEKIRKDDIRSERMTANAPLLIHKWFPGSHIYYYVAFPLQMRVVGAGNIADLHQFCWLNARYGQVARGRDAYYISPSNNFTDPAEQYAGQFEAFEHAGTITQKRNGKVARYWFVYRLKHATMPVGCQVER